MTVMGPDGLQRLPPNLPVAAVKTYMVAAPLSSHFAPATCAEVGCPNWLNGWRTVVPAVSDHADLVRSLRGRYHFTETPRDGGLTEFVFPPGQPCFEASSHRRRLEREPRLLIRDGDWRGNPTGHRVEVSSQSWVDDFGEHQDRLADAYKEG